MTQFWGEGGDDPNHWSFLPADPWDIIIKEFLNFLHWLPWALEFYYFVSLFLHLGVFSLGFSTF